MNSDGSERGRLWRQVGTYLGLAITVPAAALIGFVIGYEIDGHLGSGRIFTVLFLLLGAAAGLIELVRTALRDKDQ